jgi:hypothetical protein
MAGGGKVGPSPYGRVGSNHRNHEGKGHFGQAVDVDVANCACMILVPSAVPRVDNEQDEEEGKGDDGNSALAEGMRVPQRLR